MDTNENPSFTGFRLINRQSATMATKKLKAEGIICEYIFFEGQHFLKAKRELTTPFVA